ncbi:MAG: hypothetical protein AAF462_11570 [Thermodesulfobacteriota bacterium]
MNRHILMIALIVSCLCIIATPQDVFADDLETLKYLFIIQGDSGTFKNSKLDINGVPIVSFYYLGTVRETGHFLVSTFSQVWHKNSASFKSDPPSGTLTVVDGKDSVGSVIQVSDILTGLNSITFDTKVLEGRVPEEFGASSFFLELIVNEKLDTQN